MSDIITRLLLKTNDFDANLEKSKGSINSFQGGISNMAQKAGAGIAKLAGGVGLALGAGETFMKIIRSSQATSDDFDNTLNACKGTVDIFFQSLSTGNWDTFNNGILSTIYNMKELSALRDSLADAKLSMGFNNKVFEAEFTKFESIIRDTTKSREERENAFKSLQSLKNNFKVDVDDTLSGAEKELIQSLNLRTGRKDFNIDDIHKYISINNNDFSTRNEKKALTDYQKKLSEYDKQINQIQGNINSTRGDTNEFTGETKKQMRQRLQDLGVQKNLFIQQNAVLEKQNFLNQDNDANRIEMIKNYEYTYDLKKRMYDFDKRTLELQNSLKSSTLKETPKVDSIAWYNAQITELNKRLINETDIQVKSTIKATINEFEAKKTKLQIETNGNSIEAINIQLSALNKQLITETDMQIRGTIQATINELEQKKIDLKFVVDQEAFKIAHGEMKDGALATPNTTAINNKPNYTLLKQYGDAIEDMKAALSEDVGERTKDSIQAKIDELENAAKRLVNIENGEQGSIYSTFRNNSSKDKKGNETDFRKQIKGMKLPKIENPFNKEDIKENHDYANSLGSISNAFTSLGSMSEQFGNEGLSFMLNSVGSIGQMILQLQGLATAKGVASAFELPFPANLAAIGIVVSTIASTFANIPKFATGGIVPGTSFTGDKVPALLNSGEMILNGSQQSNLFGILNSGLYGSLSQKIVPSENQDIRLYSDVEIRGDRLYMTLSNYMKKTGKKW